MKDLQQLGVGATPSFFINGRFLSARCDRELQRADRRGAQEGERAGPAGTPAAEYYQQWVIAKGVKSLGG